MREGLRTPEATLVMPARDVAPRVAQAIGSVLNQTLDDFGLVVVNDGSVDDTSKIARQATVHDSRALVADVNYHDLNLAREHGLALARASWGESPFVAFPDGDDVRDPEFLEHCLLPFNDPSVQAVFSGIRSIDEHGNTLSNWLLTDTMKGRLGLDELFLGDYPPRTTSAIVFRRSALRLPFAEPPSEDFEMLARILSSSKEAVMYGLDEALVGYRTRPGQWTRPENNRRIIAAVDEVAAKYVPMVRPENRWQIYQMFVTGSIARGCPDYGAYYSRLAGQLAVDPEIHPRTFVQYQAEIANSQDN